MNLRAKFSLNFRATNQSQLVSEQEIGEPSWKSPVGAERWYFRSGQNARLFHKRQMNPYVRIGNGAKAVDCMFKSLAAGEDRYRCNQVLFQTGEDALIDGRGKPQIVRDNAKIASVKFHTEFLESRLSRCSLLPARCTADAPSVR